jgi:hypothetical protein
MSFDGWLDARDCETAMREWQALAPIKVEIGREQPLSPQIERMLGIRPDAAVLLAASFLGIPPERFAWFTIDWSRLNDTHEALRQKHRPPAPTFEVSRTVPRCCLDGYVMCEHECAESWEIREVIEGARGLQHIRIDHYWGEQTRDGSGGGGGSATFVRLYDRSASRGVSIRLYDDAAWTIGEPIDLGPLDLFGDRTEFMLAWKACDIDAVRGLCAQLTADLDAHFDTSTSWPGRVTEDRVIDNKEYNFRIRLRQQRFEAGAFAITIDQRLDPDGKDETGSAAVNVHGLPWGHTVAAYLNRSDDPVFRVSGSLDVRLPRKQLESTLARLAAIPDIKITY